MRKCANAQRHHCQVVKCTNKSPLATTHAKRSWQMPLSSAPINMHNCDANQSKCSIAQFQLHDCLPQCAKQNAKCLLHFAIVKCSNKNAQLQRKCTTAQMQSKCKNAKMQKCKNAKMHKCTNAHQSKCANNDLTPSFFFFFHKFAGAVQGFEHVPDRVPGQNEGLPARNSGGHAAAAAGPLAAVLALGSEPGWLY